MKRVEFANVVPPKFEIVGLADEFCILRFYDEVGMEETEDG